MITLCIKDITEPTTRKDVELFLKEECDSYKDGMVKSIKMEKNRAII